MQQTSINELVPRGANKIKIYNRNASYWCVIIIYVCLSGMIGHIHKDYITLTEPLKIS